MDRECHLFSTPLGLSKLSQVHKPLAGEKMVNVYITAIILSLINFIYIYAYKFDSLSEEKLITLSPVWLLLFIFGTHGFIATKLMEKVNQKKFKNMREALVGSSRSYGIFGPFRQIFFFPIILFNIKNCFLLAVLSMLIWAGLLVLFFQFIFPEL
jgi:predicted MFS family arabinose efflux permease